MNFFDMACSVIGQGRISEKQAKQVRQLLDFEIEIAIKDGMRHFYLGVTGEASLIYGEAIARARKKNKGITFETLLPYNGWIKQQESPPHYYGMLQQTDGFGYLSPELCEQYIFLMNHELLDNSNWIIAVHDENDEEMKSIVDIAKGIGAIVHEVRI